MYNSRYSHIFLKHFIHNGKAGWNAWGLNNLTKYFELTWAYILFILTLMVFTSIYAKNLGTIGTIYPIDEVPLDEFLRSRATAIDWGDPVRNQKQKLTISMTHFGENNSIIRPCLHSRSWYHDPSIMIDNKHYNPLSMTPIKSPLMIIDGGEHAQVSWLKTMLSQTSNGYVLLERGNPKILSQVLSQPVYLDYQNEFIHKFQIKHLPALIVQEGMQLRISEVAI